VNITIPILFIRGNNIVSVFGAKFHDKCPKYNLVERYEMMDYMVDSKTGQFFNRHSGSKYNLTDYCVDNDDDGNDTVS
jgi:hypothetical protein